MGKFVVNVDCYSGRKCGFCKHWDDQNNAAIRPRVQEINIWECNSDINNECLLKNEQTNSDSSCRRFESKILINNK